MTRTKMFKSVPSEEDIVGRIQFHRPDVDVMSLFNSSLKSGQNKLERWFLAHLKFAGKARSLPRRGVLT